MQLWILEYLASEKFVLASELNLSLATGLVMLVSRPEWFMCMSIFILSKITAQNHDYP